MFGSDADHMGCHDARGSFWRPIHGKALCGRAALVWLADFMQSGFFPAGAFLACLAACAPCPLLF